MKSKVLVKLVLVFLLASGIIVLLGSKAMVSAQVGFGVRHSNEFINAELLDVKPWWSYRLTTPNPKGLLVQPRLTSTTCVSDKSNRMTAFLMPTIVMIRGDNTAVERVASDFPGTYRVYQNKPEILSETYQIPFLQVSEPVMKMTSINPFMIPPTPLLSMREDNKDSMEKSKNHLPKEDREDRASHCTPLPHTYYYTFINKPFPLLENKLTIPLPKICDLEMMADGSWHSIRNTPSKSQKVAKDKSQMLAQVPPWVFN